MRIAFFNPQGNFDKNNSRLTEHQDFGGQLIYVREVAKELSKLGVFVDIFTRKIDDENWPEFKENIDSYDDTKNLRIIRIPFGGERFLRKELLWPYLKEFAEGIFKYYKNINQKPDFITTHYGDGGITGAIFEEITNIPFSFTAHSLGAQKIDKLGVNIHNFDSYDREYNFSIRIHAERTSMNRSAFNIVSTNLERFEQYAHPLYEEAIDINDDNKFEVISPGVNVNIFSSEKKEMDKEFWQKIEKYLSRDIKEKNKQYIVLSSRVDEKKNHLGAIRAYAKSKKLQQIANLVIFVRGLINSFEDINKLSEKEQKIIDEIKRIIEDYGLKGKVSLFDVPGQEELASAYRYFVKKNSIFVLPAFYEPFGLAPIEAAAVGLAIVATKNGGPMEAFDRGKYGVLIDPFDENNIADGMIEGLENFKKYSELGKKRVIENFTWEITAKKYLERIEKYLKNPIKKINYLEIPKFFFNKEKNIDKKIILEYLHNKNAL
ncbi:sucrose-phosphate synthase [Marinitoga hydrogenitolerans DSM 16785]|uniref:sucrose-phosphate synthase n=1 Tax=Marinitoga hydrogenitolerans (strain DSM 16785 / JCM 12826 / AT1271) TaxID=1122195 RepID=A0A1M4S540_MARH1|nr:glycosyltransferase [Marinitoga hydrogenitolerans]SHE27315.1 sucrose-phosphate synthase [Marinitoga hydrogenitolerans DSM 16785]